MSNTKVTAKNLSQATPFQAEKYLALMAPLNGLLIDDTWQSMVCAHLNTAAKMADIVNAAPIDTNTIDIANIYLFQ